MGGRLDLDGFEVVAQVDGVFMDDDLGLSSGGIETVAQPTRLPFDIDGTINPESTPVYGGIVELSPGQSVLVTADGQTVAGLATIRPETALSLQESGDRRIRGQS